MSLKIQYSTWKSYHFAPFVNLNYEVKVMSDYTFDKSINPLELLHNKKSIVLADKVKDKTKYLNEANLHLLSESE